MSNIIDFNRLTDEQKKAVYSDGEVLVSAAAGSGKTTALLARIKYLILSGASLDKMLILVYNNAAADELREKLAGELFNCACEYGGEQSALFRKQLDELSFAHIGTIHAFCRSLIRENFEKLGVSPTFEVLDSRGHSDYMNRALDEVLNAYAQSDDDVFMRLSTVFEKKRSEESLRDNVFRLFELMDVQPDRESFLKNVEKCYSQYENNPFETIVTERALRTAAKVKEECKFLYGELQELGQDQYAVNVGLIQDACAVLLRKNKDEIMSLVVDGIPLVPARKKRNDSADPTDAVENAKVCIKAVQNVLDTFNSLYCNPDEGKRDFEQNALYVKKLVEIVLRFSERLSEMKAEDDVLSFSDLEHKTVELIDGGGTPTTFDYVFVDEYQDVNPTQEYVISHIISGNAFIVGDVKQSIYGFRLADPTIFLERLKSREEAAARGEGVAPINFRDNFRSENQILDFVNGVFDSVMTLNSADVDYRGEARFKPTDRTSGGVQLHLFNGNPQPKPEASGLYVLPQHQTQEQIDGNVESEGRFIASEIRRLCGKSSVDGKPLTYGDFAVLFRKRNDNANKILGVLKEEGLPVDDGSFAKEDVSPEKEIITFLRVLDNPRQDYALAGYLLSFFGGYTEDELYHIAALRPENEDLYDAVLTAAKGGDALADKLKNTLSELETYRIKASFKNVGELVSTLVTDTDYDAYLPLMGDAAAGELESFTASLRTAENMIGISRFLSGYDVSGGEDKRSSGGDRVHVSTFHGYKGLEIPVVFVANAGAKLLGSHSGDLNMSGNGYIGLSYFDFDGKTKKTDTLSKTAVTELIRDKEYKEEMRLLYVALTRAKKLLYVTGSTASRTALDEDKLSKIINAPSFDYESSALDMIFTAIREGSVKVDTVLHSEPSPLRAAEKPVLFTDGEDAVSRAIEKTWKEKYKYAESTVLAMKYSVSALESVNDESSVTVYEDRANVGTAYHKIMQRIDFNLTDEAAVKKAIDDMVQDGVLSEDELKSDEMKGMPKNIAAVLNSDLMRVAARSVCEREKPFLMYVPADEVVEGCENVRDRVLVQGVIDLIIHGEKNIIVDYKYSSLKNANALSKYKKQLKLYKMAVETAFLEKIDEVYLVSLKNGRAVQPL